MSSGTRIAERIAFVPGAPFFANQPQANTLRLSFVTVPKAKIDEGIERLGRLVADECAAIRHGHAAGDSESV